MFLGTGVLFVLLALFVVESNQFDSVPSTQFGTFDFLELESASYQVEIVSAPVSELQLESNLQEAREDEGLQMPVMSKHGQLYSCSLPPHRSQPEEEEEDVEPPPDTLPNVTSLLEHLGQNNCLIKTVGWWTYEYCHNMFVRQYHMEAGKLVGETKYLGFYEKETQWDHEHINRVKGLLESFKGNIVLGQTQAYHTIHFVNGTECDITGQPRSAKVEIFCTLEGVDTLVEVKEDTTCNYTLTVQTSLLCRHPMLVPLAGSSPTHTLSCTPVVSQLDYEDYLLKQELIRQQKEKLKALSQENSDSKREKKESLLSSDHLLLRKLVMSSITQLAEMAYDTGSFKLDREEEEERELNKIDDDDKEIGGSNLKSSRRESEDGEQWSGTVGGERSKEDNRVEGDDGMEEGGRVSEKMKKMAEDVKSTGRDSTLESLLSNLAVTAQYIESLEGNNDRGLPNIGHDEGAPDETGEPGEVPNEDEKSRITSGTDEHDISVKGPTSQLAVGTEQTILSGRASEDSRAVGKSVNRQILAAREEEGEEEDGLDMDPEVVRDMEEQLQEALAKQFDTDDVTVKIITLPEDQLQENYEEGEESGGADREDELANAMSLLLDSLLNGGVEEPESEDRERQSELAASYDQVWGRETRKKQTLKDT